MTKTAKQLAQAGAEIRAGNPRRARVLLDRVLKRDAANAEACHLAGLAFAGAGDLTRAAALIVKAIQAGGPEPLYCANLGRILFHMGRAAEAAACFRQSLAGEPLNAQIASELGAALAASGDYAQAALAFTHATDLDPANGEAWFQLANALYQTEQFDRAAASYERAIASRPLHPESHHNLGVIRMMQQRNGEARDCFRQAVALRSDYPEAHNNLAILEQLAGHHDDAEREYAIAARGGFRSAGLNRARSLEDRGDLERASEVYRELLRTSPEWPDAHLNFGNTLLALGDSEQAIAQYRRALELAPDSADAHFNLGLALLQAGDWEPGWKLHEWRWKQAGAAPRTFACPMWDGSPLEGRRILIHAEQGLGDTLQFARFALMVAAQGGRVVLECQAPLVRLLSTLDGVEQVIARDDMPPAVDCHAPLMSLPALLKTTPASLAAGIPYVFADRELVEDWSRRLALEVDPGLFRVGLTWAGSRAHKNDRNRSMSAHHLDALKHSAGVAFFNLQHGSAQRPGLTLHPMVEHCHDFADTAAAVLNLDLIISVDTSVAHLAGALGKPVWTLLPNAADWRWMRDRDDSPWYESMRLFRQEQRGDWAGVIERGRHALDHHSN